MLNSFGLPDVGIPAAEEQAAGERVAAPTAFPLPIVMIGFLLIGYFMLRQVWKE